MDWDYFHSLPLWFVYGFTIALVLGSLGAGFLLGRRYLARTGEHEDASFGSAVAATLGLLAFLLAFTFNMAADRFSARKALLLDEVNAINTAYLRANFLGGTAADRARQLLAEYAAVRAMDLSVAEVRMKAIARSEDILQELWQIVDRQIEADYNPGYLRQFVDSLVAVTNKHHARLTVGLEYRIPKPIWATLYLITVLAMLGMGFQFGASHGGSPQLALVLALTFATVILLIADLDRSTEGTLLVDQRPMLKLMERLKQAEEHRHERR